LGSMRNVLHHLATNPQAVLYFEGIPTASFTV
jgi:hypothetical protein